jgi:hypothetical protein
MTDILGLIDGGHEMKALLFLRITERNSILLFLNPEVSAAYKK